MSEPNPSNTVIADRLEAFAALLELAEANAYSARAYRRAAELARGLPTPLTELVSAGRVRELRGIGPAIEARLQELVATGDIADLRELEESTSLELVGLGRYLGLGAKRAAELGRALGIHTAEELRSAAAAGRLASAPGIGSKTEAKILEALERPEAPGERRHLLLHRARALVESIAAALGGEAAGDPRRWVDAPQRLAVVCSREDPRTVLDGLERLPELVAVVAREERRAVGVTVEGISVEVVAAHPRAFGAELLRATGSPAYVAAFEPLPEAPDEASVYRLLGIPFCPPELRERPFRGVPPALVELADLRGDLHCHTTWSDGRQSVYEMGLAARERGYDYLAICDHSRAVSVVPGLDADDLRRQMAEIDEANERLAPFRLLKGSECDILADGTLDLPDDVLQELEWVMASVHAGQRQSREQLTARVLAAMENPSVSAISHPTGRLISHRPANAVDLERVFEAAVETGTALEVNGLPNRLDLRDEHVRAAIGAGVKIVVSTDAHSVRGLGNMPLAVATARRGWATVPDVVNTQPLEALLAQRSASPRRPSSRGSGPVG